MYLSHSGITDVRIFRVLTRIAAIIGGCALIGGGFTALFDERIPNFVAAAVIFFGVLVTTVPLLFRPQNRAPSIELIEGSYGLFIPQRSAPFLKVLILGSFGALFHALAVTVAMHDHEDSLGAKEILAIVFFIGIGTVFALGTYGTIRMRRARNVGLFLTASDIQLRDRLKPASFRWEQIGRIYPHTRMLATDIQKPKNWLTFERDPLAVNTTEPNSYRDAFSAMSGTPEPTIDLDNFTVNGHYIAAACNYYLENPVARRDLGTANALAWFPTPSSN